jgi:hypothetical protein
MAWKQARAIPGCHTAVSASISPSSRLDEELARTGRLDQLPEGLAPEPVIIAGPGDLKAVNDQCWGLAARGWRTVTFGFTDPALQRLVCGEVQTIPEQPDRQQFRRHARIAWPGLMATRENRRQRERVGC